MVRKTKEEAQATRERLLDMAETLFSEQGVSGTSLNEIATKAGLTRGAIYWHFQNKGDLLLALWERIALPIKQNFDCRARVEGESCCARILRMICWMPENLISNPRLRTLLTILMLRCEFTAETESARTYFDGLRREILGLLAEDFRGAIAAGELRSAHAPEQLAIALLGIKDGICFHWLLNNSSFDIAGTTRLAAEAYLNGLRP